MDPREMIKPCCLMVRRIARQPEYGPPGGRLEALALLQSEIEVERPILEELARNARSIDGGAAIPPAIPPFPGYPPTSPPLVGG
jgi:hypothetical protein